MQADQHILQCDCLLCMGGVAAPAPRVYSAPPLVARPSRRRSLELAEEQRALWRRDYHRNREASGE